MTHRTLLPALLTAAAILAPHPSFAEEVRLLVSIGANVGAPDETPLRYADADAERVRRLFVEIGGVSSDRAYVVTNKDADAVRHALFEVGGRIAELRASGREVVLFVYVSSHARDGKLNLAGTNLPLSELRDFAAGTGARLRVLLVDACDSGAIARRKGGRPGAGYDVTLEKLPLNGQVVITSSGAAEASEEWESLRGSLFTHHLLTALRGDADANGDGKVTLAETYAYAYRRTVATSALAGQHPSFDLDMAGSGELVLAEPASARSALVFASASEGRYVVASQPRTEVVAEVEKVAGRPLRLAVPPGRYVVRKRNGRSTGLLQVELPYGGERAVNESELVWRDFAEVAMKGGYVELKPWSVLLGGSLSTPPVRDTSARFAGRLALQRSFGEAWALASVEGSGLGYRGEGLAITERSLAVGISAGWRWLSLPVIPRLGLGVEVLGMRQRFVRDREEEIQRVFGGGPLPARLTLGVAAGPVAGVEVPVAGSVFALAQGELMLRWLPSQAQPAFGVDANASLGAGFRF